MNKSKKHIQLGMNHSTATHRLVKDLLFAFIQEQGNMCFHCNKEMSRDDFSIEHKIPWLDSEDPIGLFFDLSNISFSHLSCNCAASKSKNKKYFTSQDRAEAKRKQSQNYYYSQTKEVRKYKRRAQYLRTGT